MTRETTPAPGATAFVPGTTPFPGTEDIDPMSVVSGPGYTAPAAPTNSLAQVALWGSVPALVLPPLLIVTLILGLSAWVLASHRRDAGGRAARGATVISGVGIASWVLLYALIVGLSG